ncbi:hypothetical protein RhiirC2_801092 [Rhizophagus irregularis]|uniref:DNA-directed DNA polymerase n=1 Tax=Rhizophagus irregularis TaxID=588596 RepID=A0A2N1M2T4_9GLOM|nr:hypothetical protein RhiirC2_801092 [Rhizophagus irregularis]
MRDRHTREEADAKRCIKKGLTPEPYLYKIPELGERFEYVVVENDSSERVGDKMEYPEVVRRLGKKIDTNYYLKTVVELCARFINYDDRHQPSSEIVLEALKKLKDANKVGDNKADDGGIDEDDLDEDEEDEDEIDEDEVSKIKDALAQKSAEKWVRGYIKDLHEGPKKDEAIISHLWKEAPTSRFPKHMVQSGWPRNHTLPNIIKLQDGKKEPRGALDDSSEADIDDIIELYGSEFLVGSDNSS